MVIAVDHGNKQIKTAHHTFTSGLAESNSPPALGGRAVKYGGKFYSLSEQRIPYMRDKTADNRFLILTLFAVFKELETVQGFIKEREEVELLIGLPPAHYGAQRKKFVGYFSQWGEIVCRYNNESHTVVFSRINCYPQAYAAAMLQYDELLNSPRCRIIDIGGFTVDYIQTLNGQPDMGVCGSLENGIITFYNKIIAEVNSSFDMLLEEPDIDAILKKEGSYPGKISKYVESAAQEFVNDLAHKFRERGVDLRVGKIVFVGGGAVLLRPYIEQSSMYGKASFISEIGANARGYEFIDRARKH